MIHDSCPECRAALGSASSCRELFHFLLLLEAVVPGAPGGLHHFYAVASYQLQHPASSSLRLEAWRGLRAAVADSLAGRASLGQLLQRSREGAIQLGGVTRRDGDAVPAILPGLWTMTVADVLLAGVEGYSDYVDRWARSIVVALVQRDRGDD